MRPLQLGTALVEGRAQPVVNTPAGPVTVASALDDADAPGTLVAIIESWDAYADELLSVAGSNARSLTPVDAGLLTWLPPVTPSSVICVGTNYRDHVAEMTAAMGEEARPDEPFPFAFLKPTTSLAAHEAAVGMPGYANRLDWEAELAVIIGDTSDIERDPLSAVFGYSIFNDLTIRDFIPFPHRLGLNAVVGKGFPGAAPLGPWVTVADAVSDVQALPITLRVNAVTKQQGSTAQMIFSIEQLLEHFGRVVALKPGDVIATGSPAGVGIAHQPPEFLKPGDVIEIEIEPLGLLRTTIAKGRPHRPLTIAAG